MKYKTGDWVVLKNGDVVKLISLDKQNNPHTLEQEFDVWTTPTEEIASKYHVLFPFFKRWLVRINPIVDKFLWIGADSVSETIENPFWLEDLDGFEQIKPLLKMPKYQRFLLAWAVYIYLRLRGK